jgi:hypothetical protein
VAVFDIHPTLGDAISQPMLDSLRHTGSGFTGADDIDVVEIAIHPKMAKNGLFGIGGPQRGVEDAQRVGAPRHL